MVEFHFILEDDEAETLMEILRTEQYHCYEMANATGTAGLIERGDFIKTVANTIINSCRKIEIKKGW